MDIKLFEEKRLGNVGAVVRRLEKSIDIDRTETCFAGLGKVQSKSLTADPLIANQLRHPKSW